MTDVSANIESIKREQGDRLLVLGHHYQRPAVLKHAHAMGDSLELAKRAAAEENATRIVFCGVHFMAESADILTASAQTVFMPEPDAGCPMAEMATESQVRTAWETLNQRGGGELDVRLAQIDPALALIQIHVRVILHPVVDEVGAELIEAPARVSFSERVERGAAGQTACLTSSRQTYDLSLALGGNHQACNAALAVCAAEELAERGWERIDRASVERGVAACRWPGRLEWIELPGGEGLLDAAHNGAGVASLEAYLADLDRPFTLLFGMLNSKADPDALQALFRRAGNVILTTPPSPRAMAPAELAERVGTSAVEVRVDPGDALTRAVELSAGGLLVISGSLYLVGSLRTELRERFGVPAAADRLFAGV